MPKIKHTAGKILIGHEVMCCLRKCSQLSPSTFTAEVCMLIYLLLQKDSPKQTHSVCQVYFFDLGLKASAPSTVRHTIALLYYRMKKNPNAVGLYMHPRLPQFNPSEDKKLTFEDLGAKVTIPRFRRFDGQGDLFS
eukprot:Plantae.Rhodophyta-Purpureofilum_apyrenoidigerum.ctg15916.p1 GENE.Plantae.Rhodophyta-Purpureofilum_apyrenoidigerum.ctg15916~~Plantae.Rhodophyta-Purpureofilum_apyrenoidigerum.ctg15916.p1  ORF type:complete len:136 (+),score=22.01 Plantae.Rhodophyta-Purpureofilum_apyrenoidigerum.ctg15916:525-932(+)